MTVQYGPKRGGFEKVWFVPRRGVLHNYPIYETPDDALYDSLNVMVRAGGLVPRPGLTLQNPTSLGERVMGAFVQTTLASAAFQADTFQNDSFQTAGAGSNVTILAGTTKHVWTFYAGNWLDITGTPMNGSPVNPVRFTGIEISGVIYTVIANGVDAPRQYDTSASTTTVIGGSPPPAIWSDVATIGDRIMGIVPPFTVTWGNRLSLTNWPAANFYDLASTTDRIVAVRNLGTLGGVIYKERSIWTVTSVGGSDASFFRFDLRGFWAGPCSSAAVVDADGSQYYLTNTGRVGMWDGTTHDWVADGVWELIKNDLDPLSMVRAFGVYEPLHDEVYFYYPRAGANGELYGAIIIQRPRPQDGIMTHIAFPMRLAVPVSTGADLRLESQKALLFRSDNFKAYTLEGDIDGETAFNGFWQAGLAPTAGQIPNRVEELEVFARRGMGFGQLYLTPVYSNILDVAGGTLAPQITISLDTTTRTRDLRGTTASGRFLGLRHSFNGPIQLFWEGSRLTAMPVE